MKKFLKYIFIALLIGMASYTMSVNADSGWDGSYDSGGSSWGGSSSSSWGGSSSSSWGSSSSSHYYGSSSSSSWDSMIVIIVFIVIIIYFVSVAKQTGTKQEQPKSQGYSLYPYDINKIKEILPEFDKEKFRVQTYQIYKEIQTAWMEFDYDTLRKYTTDELYNMYHSQLIALNMKKQKNIMENFLLNDFEIIGMEHNENSIALKVRMIVECNDYVVDQNEKVVRGNKNIKVTYDYEMTFIMGLGKKDNKCPNCNAPLPNNHSSVCPYCDSTIISEKHDWVLSKKQVISQRR